MLRSEQPPALPGYVLAVAVLVLFAGCSDDAHTTQQGKRGQSRSSTVTVLQVMRGSGLRAIGGTAATD